MTTAKTLIHRNRRSALHEAAHALTATAAGFRVLSVSITPDSQSAGRVEYVAAGFAGQNGFDFKRGVVVLAGGEAECVEYGDHMRGVRGVALRADHDHQTFKTLLDRRPWHERAGFERAVRNAVRRTVSWNWDMIGQLSDELLHRPALDQTGYQSWLKSRLKYNQLHFKT